MTIYKYQKPRVANNLAIIDFLNNNEFFIALGKTNSWTSNDGINIDDTNPPTPSNLITQIPETFIYKRCRVVNPIIKSDCNPGAINLSACESINVDSIDWLEIDFRNIDLINQINTVIRNYVVKVDLTDIEFTVSSFRAMGLFLNPTFVEGVSPNLVTYLPNQVADYGLLKLVSYFTPIVNNNQLLELSFVDSI